MKNIIFSFCFLGLSFIAHSQKKCATEFMDGTLSPNKEFMQNPEIFEDWLREKKKDRIENHSLKRLAGEVYTIPVVVHVIHHGEEVGTGANISEEKITDQIVRINQDYRRLNPDASNTPVDFLPVATDVEINFELARQDPEGLPTTGINRAIGVRQTYSVSQLDELQAISYWPSDEYLNIWVVEFSNPQYLGWAQYPTSNISGVENLYRLNERTDGVYINYPYFGDGTVEETGYESLGRTLTHEIGHWLGLRHIWGDGDCNADDYCGDTPRQGIETYGCPEAGSVESCEEITMFQNYMDYTDDLCVNLFTACQAERMRTVIDFSPSRNNLLNSKGLLEPVMVTNDLGIRQIINPTFGNCESYFSPIIEVRNYGTNLIESYIIELYVDDILTEELTVDSELMSADIETLEFLPITTSFYTDILSFKVTQVNEAADGNPENDCKWISSFYPQESSIPIFENFESSDELIQQYWSFRNSQQIHKWSFVNAPGISPTNRAAKLSYYNKQVEEQYGPDWLVSPILNLLGVATVDLSFKYAYSKLSNYNTDALEVLVSTDCGATFPAENSIYSLKGNSLSTTSTQVSDFTPEGSGDWRTVQLNFGEYANQENVVIAIAANNGGGNNIFIDDIEISTSNVNNYDLAVTAISGLTPATCRTFAQPIVTVRNLGLETITSFTLTSTIDEKVRVDEIETDGILPGKETHIPVSFDELSEGELLLEVAVSNPNGQTDENPSNDFQDLTTVVSFKEEFIPLKERFNISLENNDWSFSRQDQPYNWEKYEKSGNDDCVYINAYSNDNLTQLNVENWMVSPALNFSNTDSASMRFDLSYAYRTGRNDKLQVIGSSNCGLTYDEIIYDQSGSNLAVVNSGEAWFPTSEEDWRQETIDLSRFSGEDDVKIAFVVTNQNGNNLFIDNIEFFDVATPPDVETNGSISIYPNPATSEFEIIFDFNIKETVTIRLISLTGEEIVSQEFPNTLNQVYRIQNINVRGGMYLVHVIGQYTNLSSKILFKN